MHYNIIFVLNNGNRLTYSNVSYHIESYKKANDYLEAHDGYTPADETWFSGGSDNNDLIATYDNEGNKIEINVSHPEGSNYRRSAKRMKKIFYPVHWHHMVHYFENSSNAIEKLKDAPNLYKASTQNYWGGKAKSALYIAIPGNATNIRMIRGNGWIDCGAYKFAYADRYVMRDEGIFAECTFNLE